MTADSGTLRTTSADDGSRPAKYLAGLDFSFGTHPSQQTPTVRPPTSPWSARPIEPSLSPEIGQVVCPRETRSPGARLRVTVANIPGRRRWPELSGSKRTAAGRLTGSRAG